MRTVTVAFAKVGNEVDTEEDVDVGTFIRLGSDMFSIDLAAGYTLSKMFGEGYGERVFHLVDGGTIFTGCRIMEMGHR